LDVDDDDDDYDDSQCDLFGMELASSSLAFLSVYYLAHFDV